MKNQARRFIRPLKGAVALGVVALLLWGVGTEELLRALSKIDLESVTALSIISVVMIWVSSLKWQLFVRASGHSVGILHLMKLYTIGYFFNLFLPSSFGGDAVRSYQLGSHLGDQHRAFASTFLERFTGLMTMGFSGVLFVLLGSVETKGIEVAVLLVGGGVFFLSVVCFSERVSNAVFRLVLHSLKRFGVERFYETAERQFQKLTSAFNEARSNPKLLLRAVALSLVFHVLTVYNTVLAAEAVGWNDASLSGLFVVVPLVLLVSILPLTPNGIGIQEGAFLFFLERVGASQPEALAVGVVLRAKVTILGVIGGVLWVWARRRKH